MEEKKIKKLIIDKPRISGLKGISKVISEVVIELIINQEDLSTFAIYGDWGTGKTSICKNIYNHFELETLNGHNQTESNLHYIPVWFDAWRYQHEQELYPSLLRTIGEAIHKYTQDSAAKKLGKELISSALIISKSLLSGFKVKAPGIEFSPKEVFSRLDKEFEDYDKSQVTDIDKISESEYFKAFRLLKDIINDIKINNKKIRILLFIDDLDRCLPNDAFKIIEQIKVWLDIEGYIICLALHKDEIIKVVSKYMKTQLDVSNEDAKQIANDYILKVISFGVNLDVEKRYNFDELHERFDNSDTDLEEIYEKYSEKNAYQPIRKIINKINEDYLHYLILNKKIEKENK